MATLVDGLAQSGRGLRVQKQQNLTYLGYRADVVTKTSEISPGVATLVDALAQSGHGLRVQKQRDLTYLGHRADEVTKTSEISPGVATLVDALAQSGHGLRDLETVKSYLSWPQSRRDHRNW